MKQYSSTQDLVTRLTQNKILRTFFTIYLMAESELERQGLNDRFWKEVDSLPLLERKSLQEELTRCFIQLPDLTKVLIDRASLSAV